jgi:hypothetical protein
MLSTQHTKLALCIRICFILGNLTVSRVVSGASLLILCMLRLSLRSAMTRFEP